LTMGADGGYIYDPNGAFEGLQVGQTGTDSFTYTVDDGHGGTDTATVTVTIEGANDGPTAADDVAATDEDLAFTVIAADGVLSNDSDVDLGDTLTVSAVQGVAANVGSAMTLASGALLTMNADGSYSYDPNGQYDSLRAGETGTDTFEYTVTDSQGASQTATVTVTINGVNNGPVVGDDVGATGENAVLTVSAVDGVLSNDFDPDAGDSLSVVIVDGVDVDPVNGAQVTLASGAVLTMFADGSYSYDPGTAFDYLYEGLTATDSFTYTAGDSADGTTAGTVTITLTGSNDGPVAVADSIVVDSMEFTGIEPDFGVLANDVDPDQGDWFEVTDVNGTAMSIDGFVELILPSGAYLYVHSDGTVEFDPAGAYESLQMGDTVTETVTYTIADGSGATSTASLDVVVAKNNISITEVDGSNGFTINGADMMDRFGISVSSAGDINGDGYADMIVGAHLGDPAGAANAGEAYVIFGSGGGFGATVDVFNLNGSNGFTINGIATNDLAGISVSDVGDVNGDGIDDLIIGANNADPNGLSNAGQAYVVFGQTGGFGASLDLSSLDGTNGFVVDGLAAGDLAGTTVSSAGDFNGDGIADLIVGANNADPNGVANAGQSYVVFGQSGGLGASVDLSTLDGTNGFAISGNDTNDNAGRAVSSAGDVNNDGYDDLIVGAFQGDPNGQPNAGEAYLVYGGADAMPAGLDPSTLDGTNGTLLTGFAPGSQAGRAVSGAGDINGDGIADIVIGAPKANFDRGEAYVVFGQTGGLGAEFDLSTLDGTNGFTVVGAQGETGLTVASAGDVNGDGFDDLIIGAPYAESNGLMNAGEAYVIFGQAGGFGPTIDVSQIDGSNGFVIDGAQLDFDRLGGSVSGAGDINGDGFDDIMVGSDLADPNSLADGGQTIVIYGRDFQGDVTHQGTDTSDLLVGDAGDNIMVGGQGDDFLNGGGGMDVLIGGAGNDILQVADGLAQRVKGGSGEDMLLVDGANLSLDLGAMPVEGIEIIDISGSGDNSLTLNVLDVLGVSDTTNVLKVLGDLGDQVTATGGWVSDGTMVDGGVTFNVYTSGEATLLVDDQINNLTIA
ncbi:MAG: tandem-95 repeat protein, partial [Inquilinus sp.]|nr:tandem-95 repeat protein [Inquilinus sp.]